MKILHIISSGGLFGAEGVVLALSQELNNNDIENIIININSTDTASDIVTKALEMGLQANDLRCNGKFDLNAIKELRKLVLEHKIDIIHSHGYKSDFFAFFALMGLKNKIISTNHNWTSDTLAVKIYEQIAAFLFNFFDKIIGVSEIVSREVKQKILLKSKVQTIYNGINLKSYNKCLSALSLQLKEQLKIPSNAITIGVVGRLVKAKGYSYFLESAKQITCDFDNTYFIFVGDGPLKEDLINQAQKLNIAEKVIFAGIQTDMNLIYDMLNIFVISSIDEGLPLVLLEAMAKEKPIVTTDVGAIPNVITDNENGLLIPSKNFPALTHAIIELIKDENKATKLAKKARKTVEEKFSSKIMTKQYIEVYKKLLE